MGCLQGYSTLRVFSNLRIPQTVRDMSEQMAAKIEPHRSCMSERAMVEYSQMIDMGRAPGTAEANEGKIEAEGLPAEASIYRVDVCELLASRLPMNNVGNRMSKPMKELAPLNGNDH